jgi:hypothetical protein
MYFEIGSGSTQTVLVKVSKGKTTDVTNPIIKYQRLPT